MAAHIVGNPATFATIQAAVDAAAAGMVIDVDAGTYAERVYVGKSLTIRGARASVDARSNVRNGVTGETIMNGEVLADGKRTTSFYIAADDVTIDGFTVQGQTTDSDTGAGIVIAPSRAGTHVYNNILQNNVCGLYLANSSNSDAAIIRGNLFRNNNNDGEHSGRGIYTNGGLSGANLTNVTIDNNAFINNYGSSVTTVALEAAIALQTLASGQQSNIRITNNFFDQNGKAALFYNTDSALVEGNVITWSRDLNSAALRFEGGNSNITIRGNTLYANPGNVVRIDNKAVQGANFGFMITGNNIFMNGLNTSTHASIVVDAGHYDGVLDATNNWWGTAAGPTGNAILANGNNVISSGFATTAFAHPTNNSYLGLPWSTDGAIEIEHFDNGGSGIGYVDSDSSNSGGAKYRQPFGVDIQTTTDTFGGYNIGYAKAGEWLAYTMDVATAGTYNLDVRVASTLAGGTFHFEIDGQNVTGAMTMPNTGGFQTWKTITKAGISLTAGRHAVRLVMDTNNSSGSIGNFNWFNFKNATPIPAPLAPTNLAATLASLNSVRLSWADNSTNEYGFIIERKAGNGAWQTLANVGAGVISAMDTNVVAGMTYSYRVRATAAGGDSINTNDAVITIPAAQQVVYLSDLQWASAVNGYGPVEKDMSVGGPLAGDGQTITLDGVTYTKGLGTHASAEIVYNLGGNYDRFLSDIGVDDRQTVNGSVVFQVFADGVKIYDSGVMGALTPTKNINVSVVGVQQLRLVVTDGNGDTAYDHADWANALLVLAPPPTNPPANPAGLVASAVSQTQINLTWNDVSGESGYKIERSLDGINFTQIGTTLANVTTYNDTTGLVAGTQYYYRITAGNIVGDSGYSNIANATTQVAPPAMPTGLVAQMVSQTQINLTWNDVAGAAGFKVQRSLNGVNFVDIGATLAGVTSYSDTGLSAGTTYYYRVAASNSAGDSAFSVAANATTQVAVPGVPTGLGALAISQTQINLSWNAVAGATGYKVQRSLNGVDFTDLTTVATTTVGDTGLAASTIYYYRVAATNVAGDSSYSAVANATTLAPTPGAPTGLAAAAISQSQINLAWNAVAGATGYKLQRSLNGVDFTDVGTTASGVTTFSNTGLTAGTLYYYRVAATSLSGDSGYSALASATTQVAPPSALPAGWASNDVGSVGLAGSATASGGTFTVTGAGAGLNDKKDGFQFASSTLTNDGTIIARVAGQNSATAGIMMRESNSSDSRFAAVVVGSDGKVSFIRRNNVGGNINTKTVNVTTAKYLKLTRSGNEIYAYYSTNGTSWTLIDHNKVTMGTTIRAGLVVSSRSTSTLKTATFDNVSLID